MKKCQHQNVPRYAFDEQLLLSWLLEPGVADEGLFWVLGVVAVFDAEEAENRMRLPKLLPILKLNRRHLLIRHRRLMILPIGKFDHVVCIWNRCMRQQHPDRLTSHIQRKIMERVFWSR